MSKSRIITGLKIDLPEPKNMKYLDTDDILQMLKVYYRPTTSGGREYNVISRYVNTLLDKIKPKNKETITFKHSQVRHEWIIAIFKHLYEETKIKPGKYMLICENITETIKSEA